MTDQIARAQATIDAYRNRGPFVGDDETILFQIIADMLEWCDAKHVDFQAVVEDAQEHLRSNA